MELKVNNPPRLLDFALVIPNPMNFPPLTYVRVEDSSHLFILSHTHAFFLVQ